MSYQNAARLVCEDWVRDEEPGALMQDLTQRIEDGDEGLGHYLLALACDASLETGDGRACALEAVVVARRPSLFPAIRETAITLLVDPYARMRFGAIGALAWCDGLLPEFAPVIRSAIEASDSGPDVKRLGTLVLEKINAAPRVTTGGQP